MQTTSSLHLGPHHRTHDLIATSTHLLSNGRVAAIRLASRSKRLELFCCTLQPYQDHWRTQLGSCNSASPAPEMEVVSLEPETKSLILVTERDRNQCTLPRLRAYASDTGELEWSQFAENVTPDASSVLSSSSRSCLFLKGPKGCVLKRASDLSTVWQPKLGPRLRLVRIEHTTRVLDDVLVVAACVSGPKRQRKLTYHTWSVSSGEPVDQPAEQCPTIICATRRCYKLFMRETNGKQDMWQGDLLKGAQKPLIRPMKKRRKGAPTRDMPPPKAPAFATFNWLLPTGTLVEPSDSPGRVVLCHPASDCLAIARLSNRRPPTKPKWTSLEFTLEDYRIRGDQVMVLGKGKADNQNFQFFQIDGLKLISLKRFSTRLPPPHQTELVGTNPVRAIIATDHQLFCLDPNCNRPIPLYELEEGWKVDQFDFRPGLGLSLMATFQSDPSRLNNTRLYVWPNARF